MIRLAGMTGILTLLLGVGNLVGHIGAAETPFAGVWKVVGTLPAQGGGQDSILGLVEIKGDEKSPKVELLTHGIEPFKNAKATGATLKDGELTFALSSGQLNISFVFVGPANKATRTGGHMDLRGNLLPAYLSKSDKKDLKDVKLETPAEGNEKLQAITKAANLDEQIQLAKAMVKDLPGRAATIRGTTLVVIAALKSGKSDQAAQMADVVVSSANDFGKAFSSRITREIAGELAKEKGSAPKAILLSEGLLKDLGPTAPAQQEAGLLGVLRMAFLKIGKTDDAAKITARLDGLESKLDLEFEKINIPFKPTPYAGRKADSNRAVVVELFTGAMCPPCVAADVSFDALIKTYTSKDVILLQYHLHIPGPDALTNATSESRQNFYEKDIEGTPTMMINGKAGPPLGGNRQGAERSYQALTKIINTSLSNAPTPVELSIEAGASGNKVGARVIYKGLKSTENLKLHTVLIENEVRYPGSNGQRLHHHIVRDFLGGVTGVALKKTEGEESFTVEIPKLRETLTGYLEKFEKENGPFPVSSKPLDLKHLKLVVFIQNEKTHEILQAAQADLPEGK